MEKRIGDLVAAEPIRDAQAGGVQRIRVGGNVQAAMAISAPKPVEQARIQGTMKLNAVIGRMEPWRI